MSGTLQQIRDYIPSIILKLYQRRLLDKNAEITKDEIIEAHWELAKQVKFLEYKQQILQNQQFMLENLIKNKDLMSVVHN